MVFLEHNTSIVPLPRPPPWPSALHRCQGAVHALFQPANERLASPRTPRRKTPFKRSRLFCLHRSSQESLPSAGDLLDLPITLQRVAPDEPEMMRRARPRILLRLPRQPSANRIHFHIPRCADQVRLVQDAGTESPLKKITSHLFLEVPHARIQAVRFADSPRERFRPPGRHDQMHLVGHEAPCLKGQSESQRLFVQEAKVFNAIPVVPKDSHGSHATLGDVVRQSWNHNSADSWHPPILSPPTTGSQGQLRYYVPGMPQECPQECPGMPDCAVDFGPV